MLPHATPNFRHFLLKSDFKCCSELDSTWRISSASNLPFFSIMLLLAWDTAYFRWNVMAWKSSMYFMRCHQSRPLVRDLPSTYGHRKDTIIVYLSLGRERPWMSEPYWIILMSEVVIKGWHDSGRGKDECPPIRVVDDERYHNQDYLSSWKREPITEKISQQSQGR